MKRFLAPILLVCITTTVYAQQVQQPAQPNIAVRQDESPALMTMTARTAWGPERERMDKNEEAREEMRVFDSPTPLYPNGQIDKTLLVPGPAPFVSFDGPEQSDNEFELQPPDPNGVIGAGHFVGMYNLVTEIFDRNGVSLTGPFPSNAFFNGFGGLCEETNDGDPIVLYDGINGRWIVSQFAVASGSGPSSQCIAVSSSADPLGSYFRYEFAHQPVGDYPKLGLSPSGEELLVMYRMFGPSPSFLVGGIIDYAAMRAGNPAVELLVNMDELIEVAEPEVFADGFLPVNYVGQAPSDQLPFFAGHLDTSTGASFDQFMVIDITSFDFESGDVLVEISRLAVDPYELIFCGELIIACIEQPSGGSLLQPLSLFTMHSLSTQDFDSHFGTVATHTVNIGDERAAIRWYEFRNENGDWSVHQQGTYSPDGNSRWMGSAAQDINGNIFIGYSVTGPDLFPSIAYAAQTAGSPLGQLNIDETIVQEGSNFQLGSRWGDYSMASVDPVNENSFWYTQEYVGEDGNWKTRIMGVTLEADSIPPAPVVDLAISSVASSTFDVTWTDVGGDLAGVESTESVFSYELRVSTEPIDASNFDEANEAAYSGTPGEPGVGIQVQSVRDLQPATLYYVAVRGVDVSGNRGPISNVPSSETLAAPEFTVTPQEVDLGVLQNNQEATAATTISNTSTEESVLEFSFPRFAVMDLLIDASRQQNALTNGLEMAIPRTKGAATAFAGTGNEVVLGAGGPDRFGYMWIDSNEPGGPLANNFFDISGFGTEIRLDQDCAFDGRDCNSAPVPLPFAFPYYGEVHNEVVINDNGFVRFNAASLLDSWVNQFSQGEESFDGLIAVFWDDLGTDQSPQASVHYHFDEATDAFIVQWTNTPYFNGQESNNFQLLLYSDGRFLVQYGFVASRATESVGTKNQDGTDGLQVASYTDYIETGKAVLFVPPLSVEESFVTDVEPAFGTLGSGESIEVTVTGGSGDRPSGIYTDGLQVLHNGIAGEATVTVTLGVEGFVAQRMEPEVLDYGDVVVGLSSTLDLTIINDGTDSLIVSDVLFNNTDYTTDEQSVALGPNGDQATLLVTYAPQAIEDDESVLVLISNDPGSPLGVTLLGRGIEPPVIAVEPDSLDLVEINEFTEILETRVLTVSNGSPTPLEVAARVSFDNPDIPVGIGTTETPFFKRERSQGTPLGERASRTFTPLASQPAAPVTQGFEEGIMPPTDWTLLQNNPNLTWETVEFFPYSGDYSAFMRFDPSLALQDEWIIGPEGFYTGTVSFFSSGSLVFCRDAFDNCDLEVWLLQGAPGGDDDFFLGIADDDWTGEFVYSQSVMSIDSLDLPSSTITSLAFRYIGQDGDGVLLDEINVDYEPILPPVSVDLEDFVVEGNSVQELQVIYSALTESGRFYSGTIDLMSNDPLNPVINIPFTYNIIGVPDIDISRSSLAFGRVEIGGTQSESFIISNAGSENPALSISEITLDGTGATNYLVEPQPSGESPIVLGSNDSLEVTVTYTPLSIAAHPAVLTIFSNDADEPELTIDITGEGVPAPAVALSDTSFSASLFTGGNETQTLVISNVGEESSVLDYVLSLEGGTSDPGSDSSHVEGDLQRDLVPFGTKQGVFLTYDSNAKSHVLSTQDWLVIDPDSGSIAAGEEADVALNFTAEGVGDNEFEANIAVETNDPSNPVANINVSLEVTEAQDILLAPDSLAFDSVIVGLDRELTVLVQNTGVLPLTISGVANSLPSDYAAELISQDPDIDPFDPLEPGDSRMLQVVFAPAEAGERFAEITIRSDDPDESEVTVRLSGFGLSAPAIQVTPPEVQLVAYVSSTDSEILTITNTGAPGSELDFMIDASEFDEVVNDSTMRATNDVTFLTHSQSQEIVQFNSLACTSENGHVDNSYFRSFNLNDFGIETQFTLSEVQFGVQTANSTGGSQRVEVYVYLSDGPFPTGDLVLLDSTALVFEDQVLTIVSVPMSATVPEGSEIVVELFTPEQVETEALLFIGSNPFGQTAPSYLAAIACGIPTPTDLGELGFTDMQIVMNVVGQVLRPPLLLVNPISGTVAAGDSVQVVLSLDESTSDLPGTFISNLNIQTNVPVDSSSTAIPSRRHPMVSDVGMPNTQVVEVPVELNLSPFTVSIADRLVNPSQDFLLDLDIGNIDELDLSTYQLTLTYDPERVQLLQAVTTGTVSENLTLQTNTTVPGRIDIAAVSDFAAEGESQPERIEGDVTLIRFAFRAAQQYGDAAIALEEFFFDEGELAIFPDIGTVEIVPLFGDANVDSRLSLFDAHYTLQAVVDLVEITEIGEFQAEVSGNQTLTAFDANLIALHAIGSIDCFPVEEGCEAATKSETETTASLAWGSMEQVNGSMQLPLQLEYASGPIYALQLEGEIDPDRAKIDNVETSLPDTWRMEYRATESGLLKIALMGTTPLVNGELGRLSLTFTDEASRFSMDAVALVNESASVELQRVEVADVPTEFVLHQNYPNPFNPTTTIAYQLAEEVDVRLEVYNILGQRIHTLVNATQKAGNYKVVWDTAQQNGEGVSSGTYFLRLVAGPFEETRVMLLVK